MTPTPVVLDLPFRRKWLTQNSPARRIPSHGTHAFGVTYAVDFVPVDDDGRSAPRSWRALLAPEPPEHFVGFGRPILAPAAGTVVAVHDGEPDHAARRSQLTLIPYALGQAGRARAGIVGLAGNHLVLALGRGGPYVVLAHLRRGTILPRPGDVVARGDLVAECGNSGNSTEPHLHLQVTDSLDWRRTHGLPMVFRRPGGDGVWMPDESELVDA